MASSWRKGLLPNLRMPLVPRIYIRLLFIYITLFFTITLLTIVMYNDVMLPINSYNDSMRELDRSVKISSFVFLNHQPWMHDISAFFQVLTPQQKDILMDLARRVHFVLQNLSIPYVIYGGTLLGSYRHHDMIPWDDDIDFLVDGKGRQPLFNALKKLRPDFRVMVTGPRFKFFSKMSNRTSKYPWGWPYVDIHFYEGNATHIWDSASEFSSRYIYPKKTVFPTHDRPLGGLSLRAPRDSFANLRATYWTVSCQSHFYSHKQELNVRAPSIIPCRLLKDSFPFVHRSPSVSGVVETLKIGDTPIRTILVDEPEYAITKPYTLMLMNK